MANICNYRFIVRGAKNACYAFLGSKLDYDGEVREEGGTDEDYYLTYSGGCAWYVDARCDPYDGETPVDIPSDPQEAYDLASLKYTGITSQSRSAMFGVDVYCIGDPADDVYRSEFKVASESHYINGELAALDKKVTKYLKDLKECDEQESYEEDDEEPEYLDKKEFMSIFGINSVKSVQHEHVKRFLSDFSRWDVTKEKDGKIGIWYSGPIVGCYLEQDDLTMEKLEEELAEIMSEIEED